MATLNVRTEMNQAARDFPQLARNLPTLTRNVINRLATKAERESTAVTAKGMRLPVRFVRYRFDREGKIRKVGTSNLRRTDLRRATAANLNARLEVYMRGLPVYQVANRSQAKRRPGGGIKAKGGRFYRGAFRVGGMVLKAREKAGKEGGKLFMPKIGLRVRLTREFNARVQGVQGQTYFRAEYAAQLRRSARRYGVKV